ncbi:hypothetical protein ACFE04_020037 [Oxalis oulophora]
MAFLCIILFLISFSAPFATASKTAYDILQEYGLPVGLLPKGVESYTFDTSTGKFEVDFADTCSFKIDSYELKYGSKITGVISEDKLSSLSGIKVKVWIFWFSIKQVTRDDNKIEFSVGVGDTDFPVDNFATSPTCGCGFDCVNVVNEDDHFIHNGNYVSAS